MGIATDAAAKAAARLASGRVERSWKSLHYLNLYRMTVAGVFLLLSLASPGQQVFGQESPVIFYLYSLIYLGFAAITVVTISLRQPRFDVQLAIQIIGDIIMIILMMTASGGVRSGLGLLLIVSLASSGLVAEGRMVMFHAALAASGVLIVQTLGVLDNHRSANDYGQAGLLGLVFFVTAGVAHILAKRNRVSEALAAARAVDIENMAQINQLVIDDMQDGVVVLDSEGKIRQANQQAKRLLSRAGLTYAGAGTKLYRTVPLLFEYLEQWRKQPQTAFPPISLGLHGEEYLPRFIAVTNKRVMGAVLVLEDMTRINEQAQQIKLAALGRLTANIAHEIRNPLAAISHAAEILQEDDAGDRGHQRLLEIITKNAQRINHLVTDVMALNRRDRTHTERIALAEFLSEFLEEFCDSQAVNRSLFRLELADDAVICFDRGHLQQVIANLCLNAVRHSRHQPDSVCIVVEHANSMIEIHVRDDGAGVACEHVARLFEPFFTTESAGTGLGLYISKELCHANAATLEYLQTGKGGHFRITCQEGGC
ncbi:PAS domain-containing sensor histidine kinase [Sulfuriferula sp. AH1]|uniref:sensor histidine kinase n=1 Tax=Sulfuriferula sp. AH1 TaxID=1985873 RepID=UPI0012F93FDF|nr:ATP-binding protein [Sulfuriferula sp. AH1]